MLACQFILCNLFAIKHLERHSISLYGKYLLRLFDNHSIVELILDWSELALKDAVVELVGVLRHILQVDEEEG